MRFLGNLSENLNSIENYSKIGIDTPNIMILLNFLVLQRHTRISQDFLSSGHKPFVPAVAYSHAPTQ